MSDVDESKPCQGCWEDQIVALQPVAALPVLWGIPLRDFSLRLGWVLWDLQEQMQVLTRRGEAAGDGAGVEGEVDFQLGIFAPK